MLYLLRSYTKDGSMLKAGYADNYKNRYLQYESHNPGIEEVGKKEGSLLDEALLHLYLHFLGYSVHKDEWYKDCQEVIDIFNAPLPSIEEEVWKERENLFTYYDFRNEDKRANQIYEYLHNKHKSELFVAKSTDRGIVNDFVGKDIDLKYINLHEFRNLSTTAEMLKTKSPKSDVESLLCAVIDLNTFPEQMKFIYELDEDRARLLDDVFDYLPFYYRNFYKSISPEEAKRLSYRKGVLGKRYERILGNQGVDMDNLREIIYSTFSEGTRYTKFGIKSTLRSIYEDMKYVKTPKATDLNEYFDMKKCAISLGGGKRTTGFEIIKKK